MASRLYPTTRRLFRQVLGSLLTLGLTTVLPPWPLVLMALYVTALIMLDCRQNGQRMANWLPARAHDAFNRLLRVCPLSTRAIMKAVIRWAKRLGLGYLVLDDVVVEKPFAQLIPWVAWTYSTTKKRKVRGLHIVVWLWCVRGWRIPVAFRLWRPKQACPPNRYQTKGQLAWTMLTELVGEGLPIQYVVFDSLYTAGWLTKRISRLGLTWIGVLNPRTTVYYRQRRWQALVLAASLKLKWRAKLELRATSVVAYLPKYGTLRLVVTRNRHGNYEVLATNDLGSNLTTVVQRKRSRWSVETLFRDAKQFSGLGACQCRVDQAMVRHVAFSLVAFIVLQRLRLRPEETLGEVKDRLQRDVMSGGTPPPPPVKGKVAAARLVSA